MRSVDGTRDKMIEVFEARCRKIVLLIFWIIKVKNEDVHLRIEGPTLMKNYNWRKEEKWVWTTTDG